MANVLFLTGQVGPAEGSVLSDLKRNGHQVFTYNIGGHWIPRQIDVPFWMRGYRTRLSPMARNWFTRTIEPMRIDVAISSGLEAASFAARNYEGEYYPLLWRGDLDYSTRNQSLAEAFTDLVQTSDRLMLEDPWEMDKAVSKNSLIPHLVMRYPKIDERRYLTSHSGDVAIIYPRSDKAKANEFFDAAQVALGNKVRVKLVDAKTLYTAKDLANNIELSDALADRLGEYSFAIVLGTGPHHSTIIRALRNDKERLVVDQRVGLGWLSRELDLPHRARGLRCIQQLQELMQSTSLTQIPEREFVTPKSQDDFLATLDKLWQQELDPSYEELPAVINHEPLDIFFSVGPIQDVTNGARHQRVRNMHDAFARRNSFNIYGTQQFLDRRLRLARKLLSEGRAAGIFYGENSTTPMTKELTDKLAGFLEDFSSTGGRTMWFVRDLHWLESFEKSPWTPERTAEMKSDGLYELEKLGDQSDILAAPSRAAAEGFNQLLSNVQNESRIWQPLPPAVEPQNVVDDKTLINCDGVTVLYSGGISEIYGMDYYLSALAELDKTVLIDFVVRKPELDPLRSKLDSLGLLHTERTRILHTTMDLYQPRTSRTLGVVLLDSDYAKFSFPYKTVTMIERGYPILCYSDMGIADFVVSNNLGVAVDRSVEAVINGIEILINNGATGMQAARLKETWENRVRLIYQLLQNDRA